MENTIENAILFIKGTPEYNKYIADQDVVNMTAQLLTAYGDLLLAASLRPVTVSEEEIEELSISALDYIHNKYGKILTDKEGEAFKRGFIVGSIEMRSRQTRIAIPEKNPFPSDMTAPGMNHH